MDKAIKLSVHDLVDFLLRKGDIDNRVFNRSSMSEGTLLHGLYQSKQGDDYLSEYYLKSEFVINEIPVILEGRADGIIIAGKNKFIIDEIKTSVADLVEFSSANFDWHLGQAKCYAYMFAKEKELKEIGVRLTYIKQGSVRTKLIQNYSYSFLDLEKDIYDLLDKYLSFYNIILRKNQIRDESINKLSFPFETYRVGQKRLAKYAYSTVINKTKLYVEAPTGIGKTMSTLFPYIKTLPDMMDRKLFYLTAKSSGKEAANNAIDILRNKGLKATSIVVTSKDKICLCKDGNCNPDECPYAKAYYDKIQSVISLNIEKYNSFTLDTILDIANDNQICPFELELDLSLFSDIIICDYNYLFDPISYMQRYFDQDASRHIALIDEAHNLVDRSRDMYSISVCYDLIKRAKKSSKSCISKALKTRITKLKNKYENIMDIYEEGNHIVSDFDSEIYSLFNKYIDTYKTVSREKHNGISVEMTDLYLELSKFIKISDLIDDNYVSYIHVEAKNVALYHYCLDASRYIRDSLNRINSSVLFSATFSPIDYYINTLGGDASKDASLILLSPFPNRNFKVLVAPKVSVRYKNRDASYSQVFDYIRTYVNSRKGNYFVYVPSYEYLEKLKPYFEDYKYANVYFQERDMDDFAKEDFLYHFEPNPRETNVGFTVLGGAFSEGIDLVSDRLIGVVVVGIGMPKINFNSDMIAEYFDSLDKPGKDYAYIDPGINKIMQAIGRVIRSENDIGTALLIDERYLSGPYHSLFEDKWTNYEVVLSPGDVLDSLKKFYKN